MIQPFADNIGRSSRGDGDTLISQVSPSLITEPLRQRL